MRADLFGYAFATLLRAASVGLLSTHAIAAGGAFVVDDAEVAKSGDCKVESSVSSASNRDFIAVASPACVINLGRPVELGFSFARFRSDGELGTALAFKAKTNLLPAEQGKLGIAISGGSALDLLTNKDSGGFVNIPISYQIIEPLKINVNAGWLYELPRGLHWLTYGAGFEWNLASRSR